MSKIKIVNYSFIHSSMKKIFDIAKNLFSFIEIDITMIVLLILFFLLDCFEIYFLYLIFVILHEIVHLMVAKKLGYFPKKMKLSAFGASLEGFDDFLINDELKIVASGPFFNFCIVIVCYLFFWFYPESFSFLNDILIVNQSILFFNLIPIFPLDAGRLFLCVVSRKMCRGNALRIVKNISLLLVVVLFLISMISFFWYYNFSLGFAAVNLCLLLFGSTQGTSYKREILLRKKIKRLNKGVCQKVVYVKCGYDEKFLLKFIDGEHYFIFVFVDEKFQEMYRIDEWELLNLLGFI